MPIEGPVWSGASSENREPVLMCAKPMSSAAQMSPSRSAIRPSTVLLLSRLPMW